MSFREVQPSELKDNFFTRIGKDWMLVSAGPPEDCNAMTASWGQIGNLWNKPVATIYVRPQRYTYEFTEKHDRFTLSFFAPGEKRDALNIMGSKSGRDGDKVSEAGLALCAIGEQGDAAFSEASLVLVCRKLYAQDMREECFVDPSLVGAHYPAKDFHRIYVGEILQAFLRE